MLSLECKTCVLWGTLSNHNDGGGGDGVLNVKSGNELVTIWHETGGDGFVY